MSGDKYKINNPSGTYFCTLTIVYWIDIFSRQVYRDIVVDSLNYCIQNKGLILNSWVIMSNHIHLIGRVSAPYHFSDFLRDFKKFTSKAMVAQIKQGPESRSKWLLDKFAFEAKRKGRATHFKIWKDSNHAIEMDGYMDIYQKINYVHQNPVKNGLVTNPEDYIYSSARDYLGDGGLLELEIL
jgi:putative transposase